jgi:hypothetical protein
MSGLVKKGMLLGSFTAVLLAGCAPNVAPPKPVTQPKPNQAPVSSVFQDKGAYSAQHFTLALLPQVTQQAVLQTGSAPVSFDRLLFTEKLTVTKPGSDAPTHSTNIAVMENAGNGLVRAFYTKQDNGFDVSVYFDLTYRGLFPLRSQTFATTSTTWPYLMEAKQVTHLDTDFTADHVSYVYRNGFNGYTTMGNPMQISCTAGQRYSASTVNPNIGGMARELNCQWTNGNGVLNGVSTYLYLEKYGITIPLRTKNATAQIEVDISDFKVE